MAENELLDDVAGTEPEESSVPTDTTCAETAARGCLTLIRGGVETDQRFPFAAPAVVGRFDPAVGPVEVDLGVIDEGRYVSRKHAKIECEHGAWAITDLGSSNGTYVLRSDYEKVDSAPLQDGDQIAFGNARFRFSVEADSASVEPADAAAEGDPEPESHEDA